MAADVSDMPGFDNALKQDKQIREHGANHLRLNLPGQRKAIRRCEDAAILSAASAPAPYLLLPKVPSVSWKEKEVVRPTTSYQPYPPSSIARIASRSHSRLHSFRTAPPQPSTSKYDYKFSSFPPKASLESVVKTEEEDVLSNTLSGSGPTHRHIQVPGDHGSQLDNTISISSNSDDTTPSKQQVDSDSDVMELSSPNEDETEDTVSVGSFSDSSLERTLQWPKDWPTW